MEGQRGNIVIGLLICCLIVVSIGSAYYLGTKKSHSVEIEESISNVSVESAKPTINASPSATLAPTNNIKTYANEKYGFEFNYPDNFEVKVENDVDAQLLISINSNNEKYSFERAPLEGYLAYPAGTTAQGTKKYGKYTWEFLPAGSFGDAGYVFHSGPQYELRKGNYRFNFQSVKPAEITSTLEDIISSFSSYTN